MALLLVAWLRDRRVSDARLPHAPLPRFVAAVPCPHTAPALPITSGPRGPGPPLAVADVCQVTVRSAIDAMIFLTAETIRRCFENGKDVGNSRARFGRSSLSVDVSQLLAHFQRKPLAAS